jgi:hypothetical protein
VANEAHTEEKGLEEGKKPSKMLLLVDDGVSSAFYISSSFYSFVL